MDDETLLHLKQSFACLLSGQAQGQKEKGAKGPKNFNRPNPENDGKEGIVNKSYIFYLPYILLCVIFSQE